MARAPLPILPDPTQPFTWDQNKAAANVLKHGVSFHEVYDFEFERCKFDEDKGNYGERRFRYIGRSNGKVYVLVMSAEKPPAVISMREATPRERRDYEEELAVQYAGHKFHAVKKQSRRQHTPRRKS